MNTLFEKSYAEEKKAFAEYFNCHFKYTINQKVMIVKPFNLFTACED